jgi:hypothetical protein
MVGDGTNNRSVYIYLDTVLKILEKKQFLKPLLLIEELLKAT